MAKVRLDALLAQRGLYESRSRAAASVLAGEVRLGHDRRRADKPGLLVPGDIEVSLAAAPPFVSRGGRKLAHALDRLGVPVQGRCALDVGAATGGFTDCLLQRGAARVVALDVGYGELDWRLRRDPRVVVMERVNARHLHRAALPFAPELVTIDVSFISLAKVLPAVLAACSDRFDCLALVKPQFEAGRDRVGSGGVVRDPATRRECLLRVAHVAQDLDASVMGFVSSGLPGPKGNRETFVWLTEGGRAGPPGDLEAAAQEAEP